MKRRDLLALLTATGALTAGAFFGLIGGSSVAVSRARQAPADLLARLHRRTRALDPDELNAAHELAG